jgi:hypothetical protein
MGHAGPALTNLRADIYGASPHTGRGGWTWYTGAAGWMYRLTVETLLGLHLEMDHLRIAPCVPADWDSYRIHYRYRETVHHIVFRRTNGSSGRVARMTVDGVERPDARIPLVDDRREHHVEIDPGSKAHPSVPGRQLHAASRRSARHLSQRWANRQDCRSRVDVQDCKRVRNVPWDCDSRQEARDAELK